MVFALLFSLFLSFGINFIGYSLEGSQPAISSTLSAGITASDDEIPAASVEGFPGAGYLYVQGEAIRYTATGECSGFGGDCFTSAERGALDTTAASHSASAVVYSEASGVLNNLAAWESRTGIDDLGKVSAPWESGGALIGFLKNSISFDWSIFDGDFAIVRVILTIFQTAVTLGLGFMVLSGLIRSRF